MAKLEKIWSVSKPNSGLQKIFCEALGISRTVSQILINRGITTVEEARIFLEKDIKHLHNPFLFKDMAIAVDLILEKIRLGSKILIYGDYDVDGITSSSILLLALRELNANVDYYIPDRQTEGYGLNLEAAKRIASEGFGLIITVDCGISAISEALFLKEQDIDLIITDHHEASEELPCARAIINPKVEDCGYPFKNLAGVGVAFKVVQALFSRKFSKEDQCLALNYLDIVALGTVADIVALKGENRIIVEHGLRILNNNPRPALKALMEVSGLENKQITAGHIGFMLAPRLNAVGRLSKAAIGVNFLTTENCQEAKEIAAKLNVENLSRQTIESQIVDEVIAVIEESYDLKNNKVIVLASERWHSGVIGIVASRIVEKYYRPTILIAVEGQLGKGSCRSIPGFNMFEALKTCGSRLLKFGGHKQAAGLSIDIEMLDAFIQEINLYAAQTLKEEDLIPSISLDCEITFQDISEKLLLELNSLEPFGFQNPGPALIARNTKVLQYSEVGKEGGHLRFRLMHQQAALNGIGFRMADKLEMLNSKDSFDFAFSLEKNEFRGQTSLQLNIKDFKASDIEDNPYDVVKNFGFIEELFSKAEECLEDDFYRNIGDKEEFYTKVVGVSFEGRQEYLASLEAGQELLLERELTNPYDTNAIKVKTMKEVQIGYLNARLAKNLAPLLDKGIKYNVLVSAITGGQDKNYGVNIILQKANVADYELRQRELAEKRKGLKGLSPDQLTKNIEAAIIGQNSYRPKQREAIDALLEGHNTLAIFGTGRGKSAVFQSVATYFALSKGLSTIIIYPLRALVNDQYVSMENKLSQLGVRVFKANGSISELERLNFFKALEAREADIILTTPEFIEYHLAKFQILKEQIGFFVVDESHHVEDSNRPSYKRLSFLLNKLGSPLTLAVTATAKDSTADTIISALNIAKVIIDPHVRANLNIIDKRDVVDKNSYVKKIVETGEKTVIYVNSRNKTVELANYLRSEIPGLKDEVIFYNAGLSNEARTAIEDMFRQGEVKVVVSTSAFGEGIDIPDVKHVIVYHLNFNFTEFNQQSGRAGRNGSEATIHLLCSKRDVRINQFILDSVAPSRDLLAKFYLMLKKLSLKDKTIALTNAELAKILTKELGKEVQDSTISSAVGILVDVGLLDREIEGRERRLYLLPQPEKAVNLETSLRYKEGLLEKEEFQEFQSFLFNSKEEELLKLVNRPIYPAKYLSNTHN